MEHTKHCQHLDVVVFFTEYMAGYKKDWTKK